MTTKIQLTTIGLIVSLCSIAQSKVDSLINLRRTDKLDGRLPTFYTPGHKDIALEFQTVVTDAINYYESKYSVQFNVKLAVLDSNQWLNEIIPYGFVFYSNDWLVLNTGMDYEGFKNTYGLQTFYQQLDKELKRSKLTAGKMIKSIFMVYSIHELGHYFIGRLSKAKSPDKWTNEFSATYISYEYFYNKRPRDLKSFELFCQVDKDFYSPKYSSISDFNEKYDGTGIANYLWYHSNFYFLVKHLYKCYEKDFISTYEKEFPKSSTSKLSTTDITDILDKNCTGQVRQWVAELESKTKH
ncbi:MAG: hypothetical protein DYG99_01445 [Bacteroidetes bacterium CHB5]|nr:hypothetical protein [Bacteroidetes bacterium CHB5]